jgi:hypothetical protein
MLYSRCKCLSSVLARKQSKRDGSADRSEDDSRAIEESDVPARYERIWIREGDYHGGCEDTTSDSRNQSIITSLVRQTNTSYAYTKFHK